MITLKRLAISITLFMLIDTAQAMSVMTNATGPYNHNCSVFFEGKPAERAAALAFAQGYAAARNMELDFDAHVNLQVRWRELNERVVRYCTDKSNEYWYRRFVNGAAYQAIDDMQERSHRYWRMHRRRSVCRSQLQRITRRADHSERQDH